MTRSLMTLLLGFLFALGLLFPTGAAAQDIDCNAPVVDNAEIFGDDFTKVSQAVDDLAGLGPDVKVLTVNTFGDAGNLENFVLNRVTAGCPSWQTADGEGFKTNLIVFAISKEDRKVGIYTGDIWTDVVSETKRQDIQSEMGKRFADGDFADGFVYGIGEVEEVVDLELNPPPAPANEPVVVQQSDPQDLSWLGPVLLSLIAVFGLFTAIYFGFHFVKSYQSRREQKREAQQGAKIAFAAAADMVTKFEDAFDKATLIVDSLQSKLAANEFSGLKQQLEELENLRTDVANAYRLRGQPAGDPKDDQLSIAEYEAITAGYETVQDRVKQASIPLSSFTKQVEAMERLAEQAPELVQSAIAEIQQARTTIDGVTQEGYHVEQSMELILAAEQLAEQAGNALERKELNNLRQLVDRTIQTAAVAAKHAVELPTLRVKSENETKALQASIEEVKGLIEAGQQAFTEISDEYASSSWQSIRGNGSESEILVTQASQLLAQGASLSTMEVQNWDGALECIDQANARLEAAKSHLRSIFVLQRNLRVAKNTAQQEIDDAQNDVTLAYEFIGQHRNVVSRSHDLKLRDAQKKVKHAVNELRKEKPDYLEVVRLAQSANNAADHILADARSEYEADVRLRAKAESALKMAKIAIDTAEEFVDDHQSHVGSTSQEDLAAAKNAFDDARRDQDDLNWVIKNAEEAKTLADRAYEEANASYRRHRRSQSSYGSSYGSSGSSFGAGVGTGMAIGSGFGSSSGSSFGSGSSSSFGEFGGFSGGSSGFGGGGMSGGSSSW